jgi:chromate transport protein ChrA
MKLQDPQKIGRAGRWLIFAGVPFAIIAVLFTMTIRSLSEIVSESARPYVLFFVPVAIIISAWVLYRVFPKRLIIVCGIAGWIIGFSVMYWFFWVGPGAFGHH